MQSNVEQQQESEANGLTDEECKQEETELNSESNQSKTKKNSHRKPNDTQGSHLSIEENSSKLAQFDKAIDDHLQSHANKNSSQEASASDKTKMKSPKNKNMSKFSLMNQSKPTAQGTDTIVKNALNSNKNQKSDTKLSAQKGLSIEKEMINALHHLSPNLNAMSPQAEMENSKMRRDRGRNCTVYFEAMQESQRSVSMLPDLNSSQDLTANLAINQTHQPSFKSKLRARDITSHEMMLKSTESPTQRQKRAMKDFANSISASQESKLLSPTSAMRKGKIGRHSILKQSNHACQSGTAPQVSDFPPLVVIDTESAEMISEPSPMTKRMRKICAEAEKARIEASNLVDHNSKNQIELVDRVGSMTEEKNIKGASGLNILNKDDNGLNFKSEQKKKVRRNKTKPQQQVEMTQKSLFSKPKKEPEHQEYISATNSDSSADEIEQQDQQEKEDQLYDLIESTEKSEYDDTVGQHLNHLQNKSEEVEIKSRYRSAKDVTDISEPMPLLKKGSYYAEPEAMWKKRRLKQNLALDKLSKEEQEQKKDREEFVKAQRLAQQERVKADQRLKEVQDKLYESGKNVKVTNNLFIDIDQYPKYFKYKIYDCFKPVDLQQTRNYLDFLTTNDADENNCTVCEEDLSPELYSYLTQDIETKLPVNVNEKKLLQFDSNFESGNLDSVYLANQNEYNLLCKVDTNTKGHTYWFYFKVLNWTSKAKATFNILNVARDLYPFYSQGMNIWTRKESADGCYKTEWDCSKDNKVDVISFKENNIIRSRSNKKEYACGRYYNTLKFTCEFPEISILRTGASTGLGSEEVITEVGPHGEGALGNVLCFAYALPYTYSDLMTDLENSKKFLLSNGGMIVNELQQAPRTAKANKRKRVQEEKAKGHRKVIRRDSSIDRQKLTKQQIATMELKKKAINVANNAMGQFEMKLLKANQASDVSQEEVNQIVKGGCKLLEIHTEYLYYKQEIVSQSVGGLNIYQVTMTKRKGQPPNNRPYHKKKCMYITARLHSGETHGSLIMKYIMQELVTRSENYDSILSNYVVKLVPMINTDGVTIGNARSSLVGLDLNRRWADPNPSIHPEIYFLKKIMQQQADGKQGISIYCDLHGHNRKSNCFFYGCNKAADEGMLSWTKTRLLPKILASIEHIFDFSQCHFKQDKHQLNAARVVVWNEMKVTNSFTLETSQFAKTKEIVEDLTQAKQGLISQPPALAAATTTIQSTAIQEKTKLEHIQLQHSDMHQIAKSFLIATAQYSKLEKELEKEWKLSTGWFKPSQLAKVTGEAMRDKTKREQILTQKNSIKEQRKQDQQPSTQTVPARKRVEKTKSSSFVDSTATSGGQQQLRKRISKIANHGSNTQVTGSSNQVTEITTSVLQEKQMSSKKEKPGVNKQLNKPKNRQQSQSNVIQLTSQPASPRADSRSMAPFTSAKRGQSTQSIVSQPLNNLKQSQKDKQVLKGPKIQVVTAAKASNIQEKEEAMKDGREISPSVVTKLNTWKSFFDLEEIQTGFAQMKSRKVDVELPDEEGGSDSEISEDNFDQKELQQCLSAALDLKEGEVDPFEEPIIEEEEKEEEEEKQEGQDEFSLKNSSSDNDKTLSLQSLLIEDHQKSVIIEEEAESPGKIIDSAPMSAAVEEEKTQIHPQDRSNNQSNTKNKAKQTSLTQQIDKARGRMFGQQELANQLINQLILNNNARIMQASAAPPSGSSQHAFNNQDLSHNHVLRGLSYLNKKTLNSPFQNATEVMPNQQVEQTICFTNQHRRMASQNNASSKNSGMPLKVMGQVKKLSNSLISNLKITSVPVPQPSVSQNLAAAFNQSDANNHLNQRSSESQYSKTRQGRVQIIKSKHPSSQRAGGLLQITAQNRSNIASRSNENSRIDNLSFNQGVADANLSQESFNGRRAINTNNNSQNDTLNSSKSNYNHNHQHASASNEPNDILQNIQQKLKQQQADQQRNTHRMTKVKDRRNVQLVGPAKLIYDKVINRVQQLNPGNQTDDTAAQLRYMQEGRQSAKVRKEQSGRYSQLHSSVDAKTDDLFQLKSPVQNARVSVKQTTTALTSPRYHHHHQQHQSQPAPYHSQGQSDGQQSFSANNTGYPMSIAAAGQSRPIIQGDNTSNQMMNSPQGFEKHRKSIIKQQRASGLSQYTDLQASTSFDNGVNNLQPTQGNYETGSSRRTSAIGQSRQMKQREVKIRKSRNKSRIGAVVNSSAAVKSTSSVHSGTNAHADVQQRRAVEIKTGSMPPRANELPQLQLLAGQSQTFPQTPMQKRTNKRLRESSKVRPIQTLQIDSMREDGASM